MALYRNAIDYVHYNISFDSDARQIRPINYGFKKEMLLIKVEIRT